VTSIVAAAAGAANTNGSTIAMNRRTLTGRF
jgi:hypothetical protein